MATEKTTLECIKIRGLDNPDSYFAMTLKNAYYKIRIHYMQPDYQTHKQNNDFKPADICVGISPINTDIPQITCVLSEDKSHAVTIDTTCESLTLSEDKIDAYIENIKATKITIKQLKEIIRKYFGESMI